MSATGEYDKIRYSTGWILFAAHTMATRQSLKEKSSIAEKPELESLVCEMYDAALRDCISSGISSVPSLSALINGWRSADERRTLMSLSGKENTNIELKEWEDSLINTFASMPETRFIIIFHTNDKTVLRAVVNDTDMGTIHKYNKMFIQEQLKGKVQDRVDFLIIDECMYHNSRFPQDAFIKCCVE